MFWPINGILFNLDDVFVTKLTQDVHGVSKNSQSVLYFVLYVTLFQFQWTEQIEAKPGNIALKISFQVFSVFRLKVDNCIDNMLKTNSFERQLKEQTNKVICFPTYRRQTKLS